MTAPLATLAGSPVRSSPRVQRRATTGRAPGTARSHPARAGHAGHAAIHAAAARGIATPWSALPHAGAIQRSFGRHDVSSLQAHVGDTAAAAAAEIHADAYTMGSHVVLGKRTDLFTVAHESAHALQQLAGVDLPGGVGSVGDAHERHADAVAARVVAGASAEPLLDAYASQSPAGPQVQRSAWIEDTAPTQWATGQGPGQLASVNQRGRQRTHDVWFGVLSSGGCGTEMKALLDPSDDAVGSTPSVRPPWWQQMMSDPNTNRQWVSRNVVQGHLLNEHLGGPGNDMRNLTPFAKSTNAQHHSYVEKVAKSTHSRGDVLHYEVKADYSKSPPAAWFGNNIPAKYLKNFAYRIECWLEAFDRNTDQAIPGTGIGHETTNAVTGQG